MNSAISYKLLKYLALLVAGAFVLAYWECRDNGRYSYHIQGGNSDYAGSLFVMDTRTGVLYTIEKGKFVELHPRDGTVISRSPKPN